MEGRVNLERVREFKMDSRGVYDMINLVGTNESGS
jgi:hypothetical protein